MGLWTNIKSIWDSQAAIDATIETQVVTYQKWQRTHPDRDPNAWLALTLEARPGWGGRNKLAYYISTAQFSLAKDIQAPTLLALFLLYKEGHLDLAQQAEPLYNQLFSPILELQELGHLVSAWERMNPWTATNLPAVKEGLAALDFFPT